MTLVEFAGATASDPGLREALFAVPRVSSLEPPGVCLRLGALLQPCRPRGGAPLTAPLPTSGVSEITHARRASVADNAVMPGPSISGQAAHEGRGAAAGGELRQAAGTAAPKGRQP